MNAISLPCPDFESFLEEWGCDDDETDLRMRWQLLGELDDDEILVKIPEWLAEEKMGYVAGSVPTEFIGLVGEETEKAFLLEDSSPSKPLMKLVHRIRNLEDGLENDSLDDDRRNWLENRLEETRNEFENR